MLWIFASAGTLGLTTVALVQIVIGKALSAIIFRPNKVLEDDFWTEFRRSTVDGLTADQLTRRAQLVSTWQNWAFNVVFFFVAAGLVEETLKYLPIAFARRWGTPKERKQRDRAYIDYAIAGALSFSLVEAIGFFYASVENMNESRSRLMLTLFERSVGQVGHLACAALTALRATRRDFHGDRLSWWGVVAPAVLFHGAFDFLALSSSALEGNVGWIHPRRLKLTTALIGMCLGMVGTVVEMVRREWKALNERDSSSQPHDDEKKS
ncbi:hypothetical protein BDZ45DRAFT_696256 [Acephala macrosclerotiorum]|nr:hypothetical protein BDZ45DRAFT_696256 [Acephala macrosclerotiorum]